MVRTEMEILVLSALLHDIGKLAQRARRPKSVDLEGEYCPVDRKSTRLNSSHLR